MRQHAVGGRCRILPAQAVHARRSLLMSILIWSAWCWKKMSRSAPCATSPKQSEKLCSRYFTDVAMHHLLPYAHFSRIRPFLSHSVPNWSLSFKWWTRTWNKRFVSANNARLRWFHLHFATHLTRHWSSNLAWIQSLRKYNEHGSSVLLQNSKSGT